MKRLIVLLFLLGLNVSVHGQNKLTHGQTTGIVLVSSGFIVSLGFATIPLQYETVYGNYYTYGTDRFERPVGMATGCTISIVGALTAILADENKKIKNK